MKVTKFKATLEIDIEYNMDDNDVNTTPYTTLNGYLDEMGLIQLSSQPGTIINFEIVKLDREVD